MTESLPYFGAGNELPEDIPASLEPSLLEGATAAATHSGDALKQLQIQHNLISFGMSITGLENLPEISFEQLEKFAEQSIVLHDKLQKLYARGGVVPRRGDAMRLHLQGFNDQEIRLRTGLTDVRTARRRFFSFLHDHQITKADCARALEEYAAHPETDLAVLLPFPDASVGPYNPMRNLIVSKPARKRAPATRRAPRPIKKPKSSEASDDDEAETDDDNAWVDLKDEQGPTTDLVKLYLKDIGRVALLDAVQEVELTKQMEAGLFAAEKLRRADSGEIKVTRQLRNDYIRLTADGQRAKDHLLEANLRLVVSVAKRYTGRGMLFLDLIQEGNTGLIRAADKFDYTRGYKFSTYATWWIRQAITRAMADQSRTIRIPVHMVEQINKLSRVQRQMQADLGREPTADELAKELDMTPDRVVEIQDYAREPVSLNQWVGDEKDSELGDFIEDTDAPIAHDIVTASLLRKELDRVLKTLPEREAAVIYQRFGLVDGRSRTLDEIGKEFGLTRERIRQIEGKTITKLRHPSRSKKLKEFLDE